MGVLFHGDRNGARNILLRHLTLHCKLMLTEGKGEPAFYEAGSVAGFTPSRESPCVLSVSPYSVYSCQDMTTVVQVKIKRNCPVSVPFSKSRLLQG